MDRKEVENTETKAKVPSTFDRDLKVAYGRSSHSKHWQNATITFAGFCERLKDTLRTSETAAEYAAMGKDEREKIKDHGGFVGGYLKDGRRKRNNVECRSIITLDIDYPKSGFLAVYRREHRFKSIPYTTHSHTSEDPRYRLLIFMLEDAAPEEFEAISEIIAGGIGIASVDPFSFRPNQLMYWPTTPSDGEYISEVFDGEWLNPRAFLSEHPGWQDASVLPWAPSEQKRVAKEAKHQQDPLTKGGIIGAFNNVYYPINRLIGNELSDVYEGTDDPNRYTHIDSTLTNGAVVYEDKFLYSFHMHDPACRKLLNAFDLMRVHRFGDLGEEELRKQAVRYAAGLPEVQAKLEEMNNAEAAEEFGKPEQPPDNPAWESPIPFDDFRLPDFPVDALPGVIAEYVSALAESTQTPVDMAGSSSLAAVAVAIQGKYKVRAKADWSEPLNLYVLNIMEPSERKSAVENAMIRPINTYENEVNLQNAAAIESSKMRKRILDRRQKALEDQAAKGKDVQADLEKIAAEIAEYREQKPLRLYVDDVTTEKLISVLSDNDGRAAILSTEGGIFDTLAGIYTKDVNIDVMLKGYSGDCIKCDRIGRTSESVMNPALTIMLMAQPSVLSGLMKNDTFRGRA